MAADGESQLSIMGRILWKELHLRALHWDRRENDEAFLRRLTYRLAYIAPGCDCRHFYNKWREENPPDYGDYFAWTVALHNAINKKTDKPTITLANAKKQWKIIYDQENS